MSGRKDADRAARRKQRSGASSREPGSKPRAKADTPNDPAHPLWAKYAAAAGTAGQRDITNEIALAMLPLVEGIARRMASTHRHETYGDLVQWGWLGLVDAVRLFRPEKGFTFTTHAPRRIRGAMLDGIRGMDWAPRLARSRAGRREKVKAELRNALGGEPTPEEVRKQCSEKENSEAPVPAVGSAFVDLGATDSRGNRLLNVEVNVAAAKDVGPRQLERRDALRALLRGLTRTEKLVITLYYFEGMSMKEAGAAVGFSESRASQIHSSVIARLRSDATRVWDALEK